MQPAMVVSLLMLTATATGKQNPTMTVEEFDDNRFDSPTTRIKNTRPEILKILYEIVEYVQFISNETVSEFSRGWGEVRLQSIYDDLNGKCSENLQTLADFEVRPRKITCVRIELVKTLTMILKESIHVSLQKVSAACVQHDLAICSSVNRNCTVPYVERLEQLLRSFFEDIFDIEPVIGETPLEISTQHFSMSVEFLTLPVGAALGMFATLLKLTQFIPYFETLSLENLLYFVNNKAASSYFNPLALNTKSQDELIWGIVRSNTGTVDRPCHYNRDVYSKNSTKYMDSFIGCNIKYLIKTSTELVLCAYKDRTLRPLRWSTVPSVYVHSQCLCLALNGNDCGVKAPEGVDLHDYCLSMLLRDFQRQVSYRPAVTYLDYAFQTRVPSCQLTNLFSVTFGSACGRFEIPPEPVNILSAQCFFKDLVNKDLNCSERFSVNSYNHTQLCKAKFFFSLVLCNEDPDDEAPVRYYRAGNSTLVLVMTFLDVAVRLLTLLTYLACPQLRNLPGKLLIGYQMTALLRLVAVRASLEDLPMAVRLDVAMDLASTLWLSAYLHFLTTSIKALRLPDSLSKAEARQVLLRYSLFGWALPTALSTAFFWMDEVLASHVQFGQLLFVLCTYAALLSNLYMFFYNCHFYYDVISNARIIKQGVTARSVFADLFNFALKTSLLSGAGIILRLVFTQIQGLQHLLSYYHALSTLQGLLFFLLYGCNREARVFWLGVFLATLRRCPRRHNTSLNGNSLEMAEIPVRERRTSAV